MTSIHFHVVLAAAAVQLIKFCRSSLLTSAFCLQSLQSSHMPSERSGIMFNLKIRALNEENLFSFGAGAHMTVVW